MYEALFCRPSLIPFPCVTTFTMLYSLDYVSFVVSLIWEHVKHLTLFSSMTLLVFMVLEGTLHTTQGERQANPAMYPLVYNNVLPARYTDIIVTQN